MIEENIQGYNEETKMISRIEIIYKEKTSSIIEPTSLGYIIHVV